MDASSYQHFSVDKLGITFKDVNLLVTAFTHRSYLNENRKAAKEHNERLEFLGDAVLELVVTEYLFNKYDEPEGLLTTWRSSLVRTETIAAAATKYGFDGMLRLSKGEKRGSERARIQILANTFEAVIGAIYLDQGYEAATKIIMDSIISNFKTILASGSWMDPKSNLQEMAQSKDLATPVYKVISEEGPDHDKVFTVAVYINGKLRGQGSGPSKQAGQQVAAEEALKYYKTNKES